jgi:hypothetical protein
MNVTETIQTLIGLPPRQSVLVQSKHGLGKSQIIQQVGQKLSVQTGKPFEVVDIRLSQREIGDILGMPRAVDKYEGSKLVWEKGKLVEAPVSMEHVTIYNLPNWYPRDPESHGILFLDEINRANREVQQAAFELVLDYRLNFQALPKGWRVVAAINEDQDIYSVLSLDPALIDRFAVINFNPTLDEWMDHARAIGVHDAILKFIDKFNTSLEVPEAIQPGKVYPSRRSWVKFSDTIKHMAAQGEDSDPLKDLNYLQMLGMAFVGSEHAIKFADFVREDYRVISPDEILNQMSKKLEEELKTKAAPEISYLSKELVRHIMEKGKLTGKQSEALLKFYKAIPKESASGFWSEFSNQCRKVATDWFTNQQGVKEYTKKLIIKTSA